MSGELFSNPREDATRIVLAAISAANPKEGVKRSCRIAGNDVAVGTWHRRAEDIGRILVVGAGKASAHMATALEQVLGDRITSGIVITKYGHGVPLRRIRVAEAGHPVPDEQGVEATLELMRHVEGSTPDDVIFVLLSGGASSLLVAPAQGITLADKKTTTAVLLSCGATIQELNCVRKHLSRVKGGQLLRACGSAQVVSLILSDVIGDPLDVIASGPTVPDPTTFRDALGIVDRLGIRGSLPPRVVSHLEAGARGEHPETPKPDEGSFSTSHTALVGTNSIALKGAACEAERRGYRSHILTSSLRGEASEAAKVVCALAEGVPARGGPTALILGGETTVTLSPDAGKGGRNQEFALSAAREIRGRTNITLASVGTDGTDGPTDAAGGLVDGATWERAIRCGFSPDVALQRHDAYPLLRATGDLVMTGPTGTNVMDVIVVLVVPDKKPAGQSSDPRTNNTVSANQRCF
ncbi:MAG: putative hydroxypyruvate reductase [Candidatus Latescibacteria bacterium ADurb.Bin168]|nr:MAG: putative hydroxypyruvate reductase [Candidatus Latescibacteria bacterium ADurb.Bin168]